MPTGLSAIRRGAQLNGVYEIDEPLATGGMGEIYRGHAIQTGDVVAIKFIRDDLAQDESALALFRREASALHSIHHEAVVRYFVFSVDPVLKRPYLAMEFVEGDPLSEVARDRPLAPSDIAALARRVASGLHAAHLRGIVHRDISPDNILVADRDFAHARIIDFGIARASAAPDATVIGSNFAGKLNYVSPEQLGLFGGDVTARSDIYSLGLVIAFACMGRRIEMGGSHVEVIEKRRALPDLGGVSPAIRPLLAWMLQPDPADRPADMLAVVNWFDRPQADDRTHIVPTPTPTATATAAPTRPPPPAIKSGTGVARARWGAPRIGMVAAAGALVISLATFGLWRSSGPPANDQKAAVGDHAGPEAPLLSPSPAVDQRTETERRAELVKFVGGYDIGACGAVLAVAADASPPALTAVGETVAPFEKLDRDLRSATGFEADISFQPISARQCPAAAYISNALRSDRRRPALEIANASLRNGDALRGAVSSSEPVVELLIVDENGKTYNVSEHVAREGARRDFAMLLQKPANSPARAVLLVALASQAPLSALRFAPGATAERVFRDLTTESARANVGVAARYLQIE